MEPLLVTNDLDGYRLLGLVVVTLDDLSKRSLADYLPYLIAIGDVVVKDFDVATIVIIVTCCGRGQQYSGTSI